MKRQSHLLYLPVLSALLLLSACSSSVDGRIDQNKADATPAVQPDNATPVRPPVVEEPKQNLPARPVTSVRKPPVKTATTFKPAGTSHPGSNSDQTASTPAAPSVWIPPEPPAAVPVPPPAEVDELATSPAPATRQVTIPSGTMITVRMIDSVDSSTDHVGQTFRASLDAPVLVDGQVVLPGRADAYLKLAAVKSAGNLKGQSELKLQLDRIFVEKKAYAIESNVYQVQGASQGTKTAKTVGIGTAIGAAIGAITGGKKGAVIGAGTGAGAGVGVEAVTKGEQVRVDSETQLTFRLEKPLEVTVQSDPR